MCNIPLQRHFDTSLFFLAILIGLTLSAGAAGQTTNTGLAAGNSAGPSSFPKDITPLLVDGPSHAKPPQDSDAATEDDATEDDATEDDDEEEDEDMFDMDLEDLGKVNVADPVFNAASLNKEVMSVDGTKSTVGQSPAAVYVLTEEMIRRSGVRTVPDALRLVPGVQVSRLNSNLVSLTIRGFAGTFNNKVLVQIDGRSVYSQSYGGVFWDIHEIILADIDRIEVIRGPGATIWGENAVNGVINIITKSAEDTLGDYFTSGAGTEENEFYSMSIGRKIGNFNYRIYGKYAERNPGVAMDPYDVTFTPFGQPADGGYTGRVGFRSDYLMTEQDRITTILDLHRGGGRRIIGQEGPSFFRDFMSSGGYAQMQWDHKFDEDRNFSVRGYYDRTNRDWIGTMEKQDTFEIDFRHRHQITERREQVIGFTGRYSDGRFFGGDYEFGGSGTTLVDPHVQFDRVSMYYAGGFLQEKWTLIDDKWFTWLGTKVGWNSLNQFNVQPSARTLFVLDDKSVVWGAVSQAVRLPTRFDVGVQLEDPTVNFFSVPRIPRDQLISEEVIAYEMGYRRQANDRWSWELTGFYNDYKGLVEEGPLVSYYGTGGGTLYRSEGTSYGAEWNGTYKARPWWDISGGVSYLNMEVEDDPSGYQFTGRRDEYSPDFMVYLQSLAQITPRLQWDTTLRYVDHLPGQFLWDNTNFDYVSIHSYIQMDMRLNYQITDTLDFSLVGRNLLDSNHPEFGSDDIFYLQSRSNATRGIYAQLTWKLGRVPKKRTPTKDEEAKGSSQEKNDKIAQALDRLGIQR